jgi:predicted neutral ceramidase superfamily lipid hydrolase
MGKLVVQRVMQTRKKSPLTVFLAILIFMLVASPVMQAERFKAPVTQVVFSALLLAGVWAASERRREFIAMAIIIAVPLVCVWVGYVHPVPSVVLAKTASMGVFCVCMLVIVARRVFASQSVTGDTIAGGIVVYILAGFAFACVLAIIDFLQPGSVQLGLISPSASVGPAATGQVLPYMYYSFMTLLTVGYGDVIPMTGVTRMLAVL